ncbi:MAG: ABC transporter substrate-binding protein [Desulfobacteraceae bacterium]|nr:MAG: ABC transporter substrate-binding protein [Desulfobacteraceae bacterium]
MNKSFFKWFLIGFLAFGLIAPSFGFSAEKPLIIAFEGDAATLDPHGRNETTTTTLQRHCYEPLVGLDVNLKIQPLLAESWKLIDNLTWEFKLKKGVKFHNGEPFNAAAAKFSLERCKTHPKSQYKYMVPNYTEIVAVDDHTLRLVTKAPTPEALIMLDSVAMVPPKHFQEWDAKDHSYLTRTMVGTGPYKFVEYVKDDHLKLTANPEWHGGKVDFPEVIIRAIPEDATRVAALVSGEVDAVWGVSIPDIPRVEKNKDTYVAKAPSYRSIYLMFNVVADKGGPAPEGSPGIPVGQPNPFKDFRVRKAIAHAVNVNEIIKYVMEGSAYPASQLISANSEGYHHNLKRPEYNPELGKKLLAEAGYPKGFTADLDCPNDRYINDAAVTEAVAAQINKNLGLNLQVVATPKAVFFPKMDKKQFAMFLGGWGTMSYQGTMNGYFRKTQGSYGRNNRGGYYDPKVETGLDAANSEMDPEKRAKLRDAVSEIIYGSYYVIPLYYQENVMGFSKRIKGGIARIDERLFAFDLKRAE